MVREALNGDPAITQAGARVDQIRATMETEFGQIDDERRRPKSQRRYDLRASHNQHDSVRRESLFDQSGLCF